MPRFDDDGLIWNTPARPARGGFMLGPSPLAIKRLEERAGKRWEPPTELPSLHGVKELCFDLETRDTGLAEDLGPGVRRDPKRNYIVGWAIGTDDGRRFYLPTRHEGGGNMDPERVGNWARDALNKFDGELIGAHLLYDLDWAANEGVTFGNVRAFHDIQNAEPLINEHRFQFGLEHVSKDYLGEGKDETLLQEWGEAYGYRTADALKENLWRAHSQYVGPYAEGDVDRPMRIWHKQREILRQEGLERVYEVERKLIPLLLAMRRRGVRIDLNHAEEVANRIDKRIIDLNTQLKHIAGRQAEFTAGASFVRALKERGIPVPWTPSSGKIDPKTGRARPMVPSVTKALLQRYQAQDELCRIVMEGRKLTTLSNTFMKGHILGHHLNGYIHCNFNQLKSEDGGTIARFSSSDPNLQNIPARDEILAPLIRSIFVPDEGETWERLDESQVEFRLLVNFARGQGAEEARELYRSDPTTDFHIMCGNFIGADASDSFVRKRVKNTNFCKVYGGGAGKLAETFGCSVQEAQEFSDKYDKRLPFVDHTYNEAMKWANRRGFITTLLERKQRFIFWEPFGNYGANKVPALPHEAALAKWGNRIQRAGTYMALNRKLQASAADVMKKAMVDGLEAGVFDAGALGAPLLTIHDELDMSRPDTAAAREAMVELKRIMEIGFVDQLKVPLVCDREAGPNWGSTEEVA